MSRWALTGLLWCGAALAQVPNVEIEHLHLDPAARGSLLVGNGETLPVGTYQVTVGLQYSQGHVRSLANDATTTLLRDRFAVSVMGAVAITPWFELSGEVPVVIHQQSEASNFHPNPAGVATPFLHAKVNIFDGTRPFALSAALGVGLPVGTGGALGNGGLAFLPRVNAGRVFEKFQLGLELGALLRQVGSFADLTDSARDRLGSQLYLAAAVTTVGEGTRAEFSARAFLSFASGPGGLELLFAVRHPLKSTELFFALGPGLFGTPTTPTFRAWLGASFGNGGPPRPRCFEGEDYTLEVCPELDRDHDGVRNGVDLAPLEPEDIDRFEDADGRPDPDNDGDGVLDGDDRCRDLPGPRDNAGCPDTDRDGDGIVDRLDKAPELPEDKDGFEDADGAPEPDNDGDGLLDGKDACPDQAGIPEERGCPAKDDDGDGVFNHLDNCRAVAGPADNMGCPPAQKQLVVVTRERLKILDKVYFDTGKATLQKRSHLLLDQIAAILLEKTWIARVQIEGHTDNVGLAEPNWKLSSERAKSVREYLLKKAVAPERLIAVGFGQDRPVATNDTPEGKEANRRVEFNIISEDD